MTAHFARKTLTTAITGASLAFLALHAQAAQTVNLGHALSDSSHSVSYTHLTLPTKRIV